MCLFVTLGLLTYSLDVILSQEISTSLTYQTERECVNSEDILLDGDSFTLYFHYGYSSSAIETLECFREVETILSYDSDGAVLTENFNGRTELTFNETGALLSMNASVTQSNTDRSSFKCTIELNVDGGATYDAEANITSMQYEDVTQQDVGGRITVWNEEITKLPADIVVSSETGTGLFACLPASLLNVTDESGSLQCTGYTSMANSFCNFTIQPGDISGQESKTFTACATLYDIVACRDISIYYNEPTTGSSPEPTTGSSPDETTNTTSPEPTTGSSQGKNQWTILAILLFSLCGAVALVITICDILLCTYIYHRSQNKMDQNYYVYQSPHPDYSSRHYRNTGHSADINSHEGVQNSIYISHAIFRPQMSALGTSTIITK